MSEKTLSKEVRDIIKPIGHVSQVEAAASAAGIPDLDFCISGTEGHIELKYSSVFKPPKIRNSQYIWFKKRVKAGGNPWMLWHIGNMYGIIRGQHVKTLKGEDAHFWIETSYMTWDYDINKDELVRILIKES